MNKALFVFTVAGILLMMYSLKKMKLHYNVLLAFSGLASFFAADWICAFFGSGLPINAFSLSVSVLGGIPGVILLTMLETFLTGHL